MTEPEVEPFALGDMPEEWDPYDRLLAEDLNGNFHYLLDRLANGGFGIQCGRDPGVVFSASPTSAVKTVTFAKPFLSGTIIVICSSGSQHYNITVNQGTTPTTTSFQAAGRYIPGTNASTTQPFDWIAIGWMG